MISLNRKVNKLMTRKGFEKELIPNWYWDKCVYAYPLQMAIKLKIPLVFWGENTAYERGGPITKETPDALVQLRNDVVKPIDWSFWLDDEITMKDLNPAIYPTIDEIEQAGITAQFLSYYYPWSEVGNYELAKKCGFQSLKDTGEWEREGIGRWHYLQVDTIGYLTHTWFKFIKFGHWVVSDYCSLDVREGRMSREEALKTINEEEHKLDRKILEDFLHSLGYTEEEFWKIVDKFANKDLIEKRNGVWRLKEPAK